MQDNTEQVLIINYPNAYKFFSSISPDILRTVGCVGFEQALLYRVLSVDEIVDRLLDSGALDTIIDIRNSARVKRIVELVRAILAYVNTDDVKIDSYRQCFVKEVSAIGKDVVAVYLAPNDENMEYYDRYTKT